MLPDCASWLCSSGPGLVSNRCWHCLLKGWRRWQGRLSLPPPIFHSFCSSLHPSSFLLISSVSLDFRLWQIYFVARLMMSTEPSRRGEIWIWAHILIWHWDYFSTVILNVSFAFFKLDPDLDADRLIIASCWWLFLLVVDRYWFFNYQ